MNIEEAMQACIFGERVTHDGLGRDTYISYDFNGFEQRKLHRKHFGEWASCTFIARDDDFTANWRVETRDICGNCHGFKTPNGWNGLDCACTRQQRHEAQERLRAVQPKRVDFTALHQPVFQSDPKKIVPQLAPNPIRDAWTNPKSVSELPPDTPFHRDEWGNPAEPIPAAQTWEVDAALDASKWGKPKDKWGR